MYTHTHLCIFDINLDFYAHIQHLYTTKIKGAIRYIQK